MKKLLLLTSILTFIFSSFSFAKTYSIKKEKEGKGAAEGKRAVARRGGNYAH